MVAPFVVHSLALGFLVAPNTPGRVGGPSRTTIPFAAFDPSTIDPQVAGAAAVAILGLGAAVSQQNKDSAPSPAAAPAPPAPAPQSAPPVSSNKEWPAVGGGGAPHFMSGPWPKAPVREQWIPPPGWTPPRKPVLSWYDKGERLMPVSPPPPAASPPAPPSPPSPSSFWDNLVASLTGKSASTGTAAPASNKEWPAVGGGGAPHFMSGPWPKAPVREQWIPPPGWTPPAKPVDRMPSWYDSGKRLT